MCGKRILPFVFLLGYFLLFILPSKNSRLPTFPRFTVNLNASQFCSLALERGVGAKAFVVYPFP